MTLLEQLEAANKARTQSPFDNFFYKTLNEIDVYQQRRNTEFLRLATNSMDKLLAVVRATEFLLLNEGYGTEGNENWDNVREALEALNGKS